MDTRSIEAIKIIQSYNRLRNDLDAYLFEMAEWGMGLRTNKPKPEDYGIEETTK